jgi:hypothetical protein
MTDKENMLATEIAALVLGALRQRQVDDPRLSREVGGTVKVHDELVFPTLTGEALRMARATFYADLDRILVTEHGLKRVKPGLYRYRPAPRDPVAAYEAGYRALAGTLQGPARSSRQSTRQSHTRWHAFLEWTVLLFVLEYVALLVVPPLRPYLPIWEAALLAPIFALFVGSGILDRF